MAEALAAAQGKLAAVEATLGEAQRAREQKATQERTLQKQVEELRAALAAERGAQAEEAKELDRLLTRKTLLLAKVDELGLRFGWGYG